LLPAPANAAHTPAVQPFTPLPRRRRLHATLIARQFAHATILMLLPLFSSAAQHHCCRPRYAIYADISAVYARKSALRRKRRVFIAVRRVNAISTAHHLSLLAAIPPPPAVCAPAATPRFRRVRFS